MFGSFLPSLGWLAPPKAYSGVGAELLWNHYAHRPRGRSLRWFFVPNTCSGGVWPARYRSNRCVPCVNGILSQSSVRTEHSTFGFVPCALSTLSSFRSRHRRRDRYDRFLLHLVFRCFTECRPVRIGRGRNLSPFQA